MRKLWWLPLLALLLTGCAAPLVRPPVASDPACRQFLDAMDQAVDAAGVRDQGPPRVPGFPYLRVDRFLASFADEVVLAPRFDAWAERLARLDAEARRYELANLPQRERRRLTNLVPIDRELAAATDYCRERLIERELAEPTRRDRLREQARVPDDYVTGWRILGLYPITALFVKGGIARWHGKVAATYGVPLEQLPREGRLRAWSAPEAPRLAAAEVAALLRASAANPLRIPEPDAGQRAALFASFAPQWLIDTVDQNDLPGTPRFDAAAAPTVDTTRPALFRHLSHTRFDGKVLLQLNYILWFPARPAASAFDIYAGPLDGITFRVTLGSDGRPLLFDTIHNCGCYHKFFPVTPLVADREATGFWTEAPLVPQQLASAGAVPVLHLANRTHYIDRLGFTPFPDDERYLWDEYARLRSLPLEGGERRSLFDAHGIIARSARPERLLLWPMGIRSPGAMRQWGRHATAFVGRRHFDDPYLIENLFNLATEMETPP
jgi:hypothetical protein